MLESSYWNDRYLNQETGWDIGHASPAIIDFFKDKDPQASILIPGCGNAYEGEVLHQNGFKNITLADFAVETKTNFLKRCPSFTAEQFLTGDFFQLEGKFDYIVEQTFFCALTPNLREDYVIKMKELLAPSGKLVGLMFDAPLNTEHPPYGGCKEDYLVLFSKYFKSVNLIPCDNSIAPRAGKELWIEISNQ
jgi:thiopurine S-methyltransferase